VFRLNEFLQIQPDGDYRGQKTNHKINMQFKLATSTFMQEET